jgi:hypothetical protein
VRISVIFIQVSSLLEQIIKDKIQNAFPQISVQKIEVLSTPDQNQIRIIITYNVVNFGNDQITLNF